MSSGCHAYTIDYSATHKHGCCVFVSVSEVCHHTFCCGTQPLHKQAKIVCGASCSKSAIEEKLSSVSSLAASSVKQAEILPSVRLCFPAIIAQFLLSMLATLFSTLVSLMRIGRRLQRALLHWMLLATKLLRRLHISEHLQVRYRTARMLEIWDLAASSMPSSPVRLLSCQDASDHTSHLSLACLPVNPSSSSCTSFICLSYFLTWAPF